jgi:hypothetical protein
MHGQTLRPGSSRRLSFGCHFEARDVFPIVCGIDGSDYSLAAADFAAGRNGLAHVATDAMSSSLAPHPDQPTSCPRRSRGSRHFRAARLYRDSTWRRGSRPVLLSEGAFGLIDPRRGGHRHAHGRAVPRDCGPSSARVLGATRKTAPTSRPACRVKPRRGPARGGDQYGDAPTVRSVAMSKAILVGYDPKTNDRAPVDFGRAG